MKQEWIVQIESNQPVGGNYFILSLSLPSTFPRVQAGNFLMISSGNQGQNFLRRPMAIMDLEEKDGGRFLKILYAVVGQGTKVLSQQKPGTSLSMLAPLGNAFRTHRKTDRYLVVAGGIGVAPFLLWSKQQPAPKTHYLFGFRSASQAKISSLWQGQSLKVMTDEKNETYDQGHTMMFIEEAVKTFKPTQILTCGPTKMMQAVAAYAKQAQLPCQVSLEAKMGCGIGVCLSCVVDFPGVSDSKNGVLLCKEGPVFYL